jgi:DNA-binding Lrp family transcriptional regulator
MISACILIRTERGKFDEVTERIKKLKEVKNAFPVLGRFDVVVDLETKDYGTLASVVLRMGNMAGVIFTETLPEVRSKEA